MHGFRAGAHVSGEDGLAAQARAALSARGPLATAAPGFSAGAAQQPLAAATAEPIEARDASLADAGTGTGKTFAYRVPMLLSGGERKSTRLNASPSFAPRMTSYV